MQKIDEQKHINYGITKKQTAMFNFLCLCDMPLKIANNNENNDNE